MLRRFESRLRRPDLVNADGVILTAAAAIR